MRLRPVVQLVIVASLSLASCSDDEPTTLSPGGASTTQPPTSAPSNADAGVLYLQHAVTASIEADGDVLRVMLNGVERRSQWLTNTGAGTVPTGQITTDWEDLGLEETRPQAALVPASADEGGALLELGEPAWEESTRVLVYEATIPSTPDPRLEGMISGDLNDPPGQLGALTIVIHHPDGDAVPESRPTTTTTTTASTTTTVASGSTTTTSTLPPTSDGTGPVTIPTTTTTVFVPPPPPPTAPQPPPEGDPRIVANTDAIRLPSAGGTTTFTLRNVGSGVGSWYITAPTRVGITVAPSSGLLFAGSSTSIQVTYDGTYEVDDFATSLTVVTPTGRITIDILVAGS